MKIRIKEPGYEKLTGPFGMVKFENGVSEDITQREADQIGASVRVEVVGEGSLMNTAYEDGANVPAPYVNIGRDEEEPNRIAPQRVEPAPDTESAPKLKWTEEMLGEIADKEGIRGLRKVGDVYSVKATSIAGLIQEILQAQTSAAQSEV